MRKRLTVCRRAAPQRMPPFTMEAQRWIWGRQNPPPGRCKEQKFLLGYVEVRRRLPGVGVQQPFADPRSGSVPSEQATLFTGIRHRFSLVSASHCHGP